MAGFSKRGEFGNVLSVEDPDNGDRDNHRNKYQGNLVTDRGIFMMFMVMGIGHGRFPPIVVVFAAMNQRYWRRC